MQSILNFLTQLAANNNREWFQAHKDEYDTRRADFVDFVKDLLTDMAILDPRLEGLEVKNCLFRIYRDVRFSKDKRPYKSNFSAWFADPNRSLVVPGYYVHIQPGESFVAGGLWMPPAEELKKIRQEIDYNGSQVHAILQNPDFQKFYKGFSEEEKLKKAPKDYPADHVDIELLKLKSFTVSHPVTDPQLSSPEFKDYCISAFRALKPLNDFLKTAID